MGTKKLVLSLTQDTKTTNFRSKNAQKILESNRGSLALLVLDIN
jgi:hypothetical protein